MMSESISSVEFEARAAILDRMLIRPWERGDITHDAILWEGRAFQLSNDRKFISKLIFKATKSGSFGSTRDCKYKESLDGAFDDQKSDDIRH